MVLIQVTIWGKPKLSCWGMQGWGQGEMNAAPQVQAVRKHLLSGQAVPQSLCPRSLACLPGPGLAFWFPP